MKTLARHASGLRSRSHSKAQLSPFGPVEGLLNIPLPATVQTDAVPKGGGVALVEMDGRQLTLRFLRPSLLEDATLTGPEAAALARGGVEPVSREELRRTEAQTAAAYQRLCASSLDVEEAARRLGVNPSRVRQRLAERSLYGIKDGNAWLLPAFQFVRRGLVPGIDRVLRRLPPDIAGPAVVRWFGSPNPDLCARDDEDRPLTPLQWLLGGNPPATVAELAAAL